MNKPKIYDCFTFFNENELLELRFMTLYDTVDYFVIVEAGQTFTGKPKPFNFVIPEQYADKIRYIKLMNLPSKSAWDNEFFQRNSITKGLYDASPDDFVIISDVDEIPNPEAIQEGITHDTFILEQRLFYYYVNCEQAQLWPGPVGMRKRLLISPQAARNSRGSGVNVILNGGWHYSFLGGVKCIQEKLDAFAETQVNTSDVNNSENISRCLDSGEDIFHRRDKWAQKRFVTDNDHPQLREWLDKYPYHKHI